MAPGTAAELHCAMTIQVATAVAIAELPPQDGGEGAWGVRGVVTSDLILEHAGIAAKDSAKRKPAQKAARLLESQVDETCFRRSLAARGVNVLHSESNGAELGKTKEVTKT